MIIEDKKNNRIIAPEGRMITKDGEEFVLVHYLSDSDNVDDWWDVSKEYAERSKADELLSVSG